jgi:hypothetical protein
MLINLALRLLIAFDAVQYFEPFFEPWTQILRYRISEA